MDNKAKTGSEDKLRINIGEKYEVKYWIERFGVTGAQLQEAVKKVGPMADDVEAFLKK